MISPLKKIRTPHHCLKEFEKFLLEIEKIPEIQRIIPWPIQRQQKGTSDFRLHFSYFIETGLQMNMIKWSTAQKLIIVCGKESKEIVLEKINSVWTKINEK